MRFTSTAVALALAAFASAATISTDFEAGHNETLWGIIVTAQSGGSATIDSTKAKSGTRSIKVVSSGGYSNHVFYGLKNISAITSGGDIYGRYNVYVDYGLHFANGMTDANFRSFNSNFQSGFTQEHTTHMVMTDSSAQTLRMGGQFGVLNWNRASDDSIMPDGSPQSNNGSIAIKANTWYCVEFHLSSSSGQIETWVDGKVVPSLTTPQTRWGSSYKPRVSDWGLGWESYGSARNTAWFDDLALSNTRVGGCTAA